MEISLSFSAPSSAMGNMSCRLKISSLRNGRIPSQWIGWSLWPKGFYVLILGVIESFYDGTAVRIAEVSQAS